MAAMDSVIRVVSSGAEVDPRWQALITIDTKTGQPVTSRSLLFGKYRYFLVTNNRSPHGRAEYVGLPMEVRDFEAGRSVGIKVDYRIECSPGREGMLASAVGSAESPEEGFHALLLGWLHEIVQRNGEAAFIESFDHHQTQIRTYLRDRAEREMGTILNVRLTLEDGGSCAPVRLQQVTLQVPLADGGPVAVTFDADIEVPAQLRARALRHAATPAGFEQRLRQHVQEYFAKTVTLTQYYEKLSTEVRTGVLRHVGQVFEAEGRAVTRVELRGSAVPARALEQRVVEHKFGLRIGEQKKDVTVENRMLLKRVSIGKYVSAGAPELESWAKNQVQSIASEVLVKATYTDLCFRFEPLRKTIEARMKDAARSVGYDVDHFVTVTDLRVHRKEFSFHLEPAHLPTKDASVLVGLAIFVEGRIRDLSKLASYLSQDADFEEALKKRVVEAARYLLCRVDPESFYVYFEGGRTPNQLSVEHQLKEAIVAALARDLGAEVTGITCNPLETDISKLFVELIKKPTDLVVSVLPRGTAEEIVFDGTFDAQAVTIEGWREFVQRRPTLEMVHRELVKQLSAELSEVDIQWLLDAPYQDMKRQINERIRAGFAPRFGLDVEMVSWSRRRTAAEAKKAANHANVIDARAEVDREVLDAHKQAAITRITYHTQSIEELKTHIQALKADLRTAEHDDPVRAGQLRQVLEQHEQKLLDKLGAGGLGSDIESQFAQRQGGWKALPSLAGGSTAPRLPAPKPELPPDGTPSLARRNGGSDSASDDRTDSRRIKISEEPGDAPGGGTPWWLEEPKAR
jgi:hypothetical protein